MTPPALLSPVGYPIVPDAPVDLASWHEAAAQRGYGYRDVWAAPALTGVLFREGQHAVATGVVDALDSPSPFLAGSLTATYGTSRATVASSFIAIPLARSMASALLVNARGGVVRQADISLGSWQAMKFRANFDRLFTVYRPLGQSAPTLEIFTPELIEMFLQIMPGSDAELVDDWIFVYRGEDSNKSRDSLDRIERIVARVHEAIVRRNFDALHEEPAPVVEPRRRAGEMALFSTILAVTSVAAGALVWMTMLAH